MSFKMNKESYIAVITEDIDKLNKFFPKESLEREHIEIVLRNSIKFNYPEKDLETELAAVKAENETLIKSCDERLIALSEISKKCLALEAERDRLKEERTEMIEVMQIMVCKVNAVTAFHRHHNKIPIDKLDELSNYQLDFEKELERAKQK